MGVPFIIDQVIKLEPAYVLIIVKLSKLTPDNAEAYNDGRGCRLCQTGLKQYDPSHRHDV